MKVDRLQRQIRATKDKESITTAEMKKLKDDLSRSDQATFCSSWNDSNNCLSDVLFDIILFCLI